ncbi:Homeobox-leucine zipper protein [Nymphaea thermarum]|nr:Homeobox-leucine zipper protein [Nymphaea thermarum]
MAGSSVFRGEPSSDVTPLISSPLNSMAPPLCSSQSFHGSTAMVNLQRPASDASGRSFPRPCDQDCDEGLDDSVNAWEKKRRLRPDQVRFLEKSFEVENKLEPERKVQLAVNLGLQPRQVAIWFQNRRARWKTKQLEKDYDKLKEKYDRLKADHEALIHEKENLQAEVIMYTNLLNSNKEDRREPQSVPDLSKVLQSSQYGHADAPSREERLDEAILVHKPKFTSATVATIDPSCQQVSEVSRADEGQEEPEKNLITESPYVPKVEDAVYKDPPEGDAASYGFVSDDQYLWFWPL